jgi:spermidine/putrescine transport system ATP-binding protein
VEVGRCFGRVTALAGVNLQVRRGEFFSLLGPSGCGKTTLLRLLAGLDRPDTGEIRLGGRPATDLPAHRRPVNTVFQSYALFPHLSVRDNVAFGLRMKRVPAPERERRLAAVMELTRIAELADRRALVNEPEVLLLDEPLAALDADLRRRLQTELKALQRRLGITFILVTHDQQEALALSDRLGLLRAGRLEQVGPPRLLYAHPRTRFVAEFLGACNLLPARPLTRPGEARPVFETALGPVEGAGPPPGPDRVTVTLAIRPEHIELARGGEATGTNSTSRLNGHVLETVFTGAETRYLVEVRGQRLRVQVPNAAAAGPPRAPGEAVSLRLPPEAVQVLED